MNMGTELTTIREALEYGKEARPRSPLFDKAIEALEALSQQPPVYAMSRDYARLYDHLAKGCEAFAKRDHPFLSGFRHPIGLELVRGNIETRNEAYKNEVFNEKDKFVRWCENVSIEWLAPSPQAVTVEGIMEVVGQWCWDHNMRQPDVMHVLRTRLDQYLNQR